MEIHKASLQFLYNLAPCTTGGWELTPGRIQAEVAIVGLYWPSVLAADDLFAGPFKKAQIVFGLLVAMVPVTLAATYLISLLLT